MENIDKYGTKLVIIYIKNTNVFYEANKMSSKARKMASEVENPTKIIWQPTKEQTLLSITSWLSKSRSFAKSSAFLS